MYWLHVMPCGRHMQCHLAPIDANRFLLQCISGQRNIMMTKVSAPTAYRENDAKRTL